MISRVFIRSEVGERLRTARTSRGLTQPDIAAEIGMSVSDVSGWERGRYLPGSTSLAYLVLALNVSADWILFGQGAGPSGEKAVDSNIQKSHIKESSYA